MLLLTADNRIVIGHWATMKAEETNTVTVSERATVLHGGSPLTHSVTPSIVHCRASCFHPTQEVQQRASVCRVPMNLHLGKHGRISLDTNTLVCFSIKTAECFSELLSNSLSCFWSSINYLTNLFMVCTSCILFV